MSAEILLDSGLPLCSGLPQALKVCFLLEAGPHPLNYNLPPGQYSYLDHAFLSKLQSLWRVQWGQNLLHPRGSPIKRFMGHITHACA